jgi:hypothetical protein
MRRSDDSHAVVHTEPSRRFARGRAHRAIATIRTRSCTPSHRDDSHAVVHTEPSRRFARGRALYSTSVFLGAPSLNGVDPLYR